MLVLDAPHPWPQITPRLLAEGWRSWYTWVVAAPALGPWAMRQGWIAKSVLSRGNVGSPFTGAEVDAYLEGFREPARAHAATQLYRYYQRAFREAVTGRWRSHRLKPPTRILFGAHDRYVSPRLLPGYEPYAHQMETEVVPDSGHFLVDEKPELVAERAREFFA
jgi:pimeloyl-ACP methyl ester carboxylesterase